MLVEAQDTCKGEETRKSDRTLARSVTNSTRNLKYERTQGREADTYNITFKTTFITSSLVI